MDKYDISKYLAYVQMSSKKRILVEGRDDKAHISNLLDVVLGNNTIKIDTAENIKGECKTTAKNNRAKIDQIHCICKTSNQHRNLYFLCDREFLKFNIDKEIKDLMEDHENDGNLSWTIGHSLENYFIESDLIADAYSYLSGSEFKSHAINLFKQILPSSLKLVVAITLAAKEIDKCTYPAGTIHWQDFVVSADVVNLNIDKWKIDDSSKIVKDFRKSFKHYLPIVDKTDEIICSKICRGHTAILMLQRIFSACLYSVGCETDEPLARKDASDFGMIKEASISNALSEAWVRMIKNGSKNYPVNLVSSVAGVSY